MRHSTRVRSFDRLTVASRGGRDRRRRCHARKSSGAGQARRRPDRLRKITFVQPMFPGAGKKAGKFEKLASCNRISLSHEATAACGWSRAGAPVAVAVPSASLAPLVQHLPALLRARAREEEGTVWLQNAGIVRTNSLRQGIPQGNLKNIELRAIWS